MLSQFFLRVAEQNGKGSKVEGGKKPINSTGVMVGAALSVVNPSWPLALHGPVSITGTQDSEGPVDGLGNLQSHGLSSISQPHPEQLAGSILSS